MGWKYIKLRCESHPQAFKRENKKCWHFYVLSEKWTSVGLSSSLSPNPLYLPSSSLRSKTLHMYCVVAGFVWICPWRDRGWMEHPWNKPHFHPWCAAASDNGRFKWILQITLPSVGPNKPHNAHLLLLHLFPLSLPPSFSPSSSLPCFNYFVWGSQASRCWIEGTWRWSFKWPL